MMGWRIGPWVNEKRRGGWKGETQTATRRRAITAATAGGIETPHISNTKKRNMMKVIYLVHQST